MKEFLITTAIFFCLNGYAQKTKHFEPDPKGMKFIPQGSFQMKDLINGATTKISVDAFWMSNEITNAEYREFIDYANQHPDEKLSWVNLSAMAADKKNGKEVNVGNYTSIVKFSEISSNPINTSDLPKADYFSDKNYDNFPVAGVSYRNATFYCMWKTQMENKELASKGKPYIQEYRLPLEAEWAYVASQGSTGTLAKSKAVQPVKSGKPNKYGLCHMSDNLGEWTATPGESGERIIRGASWKGTPSVDDRRGMDENSSAGNIGFRVVRSFIGKR